MASTSGVADAAMRSFPMSIRRAVIHGSSMYVNLHNVSRDRAPRLCLISSCALRQNDSEMVIDAKLLPLFPLPNVVLFPGVLLPLHIFEPRYRAMIGDALRGDRRIGMVLLRPGWESGYQG